MVVTHVFHCHFNNEVSRGGKKKKKKSVITLVTDIGIDSC